MRQLDQPELRFLILRGVQSLPKSVLRDLQSGAPVTRMPALQRATDVIQERLSFLDYFAPEPMGNIFAEIASKSPKPGRNDD